MIHIDYTHLAHLIMSPAALVELPVSDCVPSSALMLRQTKDISQFKTEAYTSSAEVLLRSLEEWCGATEHKRASGRSQKLEGIHFNCVFEACMVFRRREQHKKIWTWWLTISRKTFAEIISATASEHYFSLGFTAL